VSGRRLLAAAVLALCAGGALACAGAPQAGTYAFDREALVAEIVENARESLRVGDRELWARLDANPAHAAVPRPWLKPEEWKSMPAAEREAFLERAAAELANSPEMRARLEVVRLQLVLAPDCGYTLTGGNAQAPDRTATGRWRVEDGRVVLADVQTGGAIGTADFHGEVRDGRVKFRRGPNDLRGMLPLKRIE